MKCHNTQLATKRKWTPVRTFVLFVVPFLFSFNSVLEKNSVDECNDRLLENFNYEDSRNLIKSPISTKILDDVKRGYLKEFNFLSFPPTNDECATAISLTQNSSCINTSGTVLDATDSGVPPPLCDGFIGTPDDDVWYSFVATSNNPTIQITPNFDSVIELFSGTCGALTSIGCADLVNSILTSGLTVGQTYYIRVSSYFAAPPADPTFDICVMGASSGTGGPESDCDGATVICSSSTVNFNPSGPGIDDFASAANDDGCMAGEHLSTWYYFELGSTTPPGSIIEFTLTPDGGVSEDYDFAIWGPSNATNPIDCTSLGSPIRCSYATPGPPDGAIGLQTGAGDTSEGAGGDGFVESLVVNPGDGFYLLVDNFSSSFMGFSLTWGGSGAPFLDCSADPTCSAEAGTFTVDLDGVTQSDCGTYNIPSGSTLTFTSNGDYTLPDQAITGVPAGIGFGIFSCDPSALDLNDPATYDSATNPCFLGLDPEEDPAFSSNTIIDAFETNCAGVSGSDGSWPSTVWVVPVTLDIVLLGIPAIDSDGDNCVDAGCVMTINYDPLPTFGCGDVFTDSGGSTGNYCDNENTSWLICPTNPGDVVNLNFTAFNVQGSGSCQDELSIYDGMNSSSPELGSGYCGTSLPGSFTSTDASGCLYVTFISNGSTNATGWTADITCCTPFTPNTASLEACDEGIGTATFDLTSVNNTVSGGTGTVNWYIDAAATNPIANPSSYVSGTGQVYATVTSGVCVSNSVAVNLTVTTVSLSSSTTATTCLGASNGSIELTILGGDPTYNYNWMSGVNTGSGSGTSITNLSSGTYSITVSDANGCSNTLSTTVADGPEIIVSGTSTPTLCDAATDGTITLSITGGNPTYTYNWNNGGVTGSGTGTSLTNLNHGTYLITVTDANSCSSTTSVTVVQGPSISVSGTATDVTCSGGTDGSINLNYIGGSAPYSFSWTNGGASGTGVGNNINGLAAGVYTINVEDNNNCTATTTVTVNDGAVVSVSGTSTQVLCEGGSDGSIDLTISGGTPPYNYNWTSGGDSGSGTGSNIPNLSGGSYLITVTDANSCFGTTSVSVMDGLSLDLSAVIDSPTCSGGSDGSINISVSNGAAPYNYNWDNGTSTGSGSGTDISGVPSGNYDITITDANTCTGTITVFLIDGSNIILNGSSTPVSCFGGNNGTINVIITGGTPTFTYNWSNGTDTGSSSGFGTSINLNNLSAGTYDITVTASNTCTGTTSIVVNDGPPFSASGTGTGVSCFGGGDGSISLNISGGSPSYSYNWTNGGNSGSGSGSTISNLNAGTYQITVTDNNSCTTTTSVTVDDGPIMSVTATGNDTQCSNSSDGSIDLNISGGTPTYNYNWTGGGNSGSGSGTTISNLSAGTYNITVTDTNGCSNTTSATVSNPTGITLSCSENSPVSTVGGGDGVGEVIITGGTPTFTINWGSGSLSGQSNGSNLISNLPANTYSVTVTDMNGCTATCSFTISDPSCMMTASASASNVTCSGGNDGSINLTVTGDSGGLTFDWNDNTLDGIQNPSGLTTGTYTVTVTDAAGCVATASATVNDGTSINVNGSASAAACSGGSDGSITLNITGGAPTYNYNWTSGGNSGSGSGTLISNLSTGTYNITITDANSCTGTTTVFVGDGAMVSVNGTSSNVSCSGGNDGSITLNITGGTPAYNFNWTSGGNSGSGTGTNISNLPSGTYNITVTDANACTGTTTVFVGDGAVVSVNGIPTAVTCAGGNDGSISLNISGGLPTYNFNWTSGGNSGSGSGTTISNLTAGNYNITVTDANLCTATTTVSISDGTNITVIATANDVQCTGGNDGSIDLNISGGSPTYSYNWTSGGNSGSGTGTNIPGLSSGTYQITVTDINSCTGSTSVTVNESPSLTLSCAQNSPVSMVGGSDGVGEVTITGGSPTFTINWGSGSLSGQPNGTNLITNLSAGNYSVTVTDMNGCNATCSFTISDPSCTMTAFAAASDVACAGGNDGSIDLTINNSTGSLTFDWSDNSLDGTEDPSGLSAGTYTVTVTDAAGCMAIASATVNDGVNLNVTGIPSPVTCAGGSDGGISLNITSGTPGYTYNWISGSDSGSGSGTNISGLSAGSYDITITDANTCTGTTSVVIIDGNNLIVNGTPIAVTCFGGNNGSISLNISGGTPAYNYNWSSGANTGSGTGTTIANLSAGLYDITVTDANSCSGTVSVNVSDGSLLSVSGFPTDVTCAGGNDGSISLSITGGSPNYNFNWSGAGNSGSGSGTNIAGLQGGTYQITVTDANGCTGTTSVVVGEGQPAVVNSVPTNVSCSGAGDGSITLLITGGTPGYNYNWTSGGNSGSGSGTLISDLNSGTYQITVTDAVGCTGTTTTTISEPPPMTLSCEENSPVSVIGGSDGIGQVNISGGTPLYDIQWSTGSLIGQSSTTILIPGLSAGNYTVTVTDANGCSSTCTFTISDPSCALSAIAIPDAVTCAGGNDGSIQLTVFNAIGAIDYDWSLNSIDGMEDPVGLFAGNYSVTITDAAGCVAITSVTVPDGATLQVNATPTEVTCLGGMDGSISLNIIGGIPTYNYNWNNGFDTGSGTGTNITGLSSGSYNITVIDANGCQGTTSVNVNPGMIITVNAIPDAATCLGGNDGSIALNLSGGVPPYNYNWTNGGNSGNGSGTNILNLSAGVYQITVTDANGCSGAGAASVSDGNVIVVDPNATSVTCAGGNDGSINLNITGGTPNYTYNWTNGGLSGSGTGTNIAGLFSGVYQITVTDANGCTGTTFEFVDVGSIVNVNAIPTNTSCVGTNDGSILLQVNGGTPNYNYNWSSGGNTGSGSGVLIEDLTPGTYNITLTDNNGCFGTTSATISQPPPLNISCSQLSPVSVIGGNDGVAEIIISGGTPLYDIDWGSGTLIGLSAGSNVISNLSAGNYSLTLTDDNGCIAECSFTISDPSCAISATAQATNVTCFEGSDGSIDLTVENSTGDLIYNWDFNPIDGIEDPNNLEAGTYTVTITDESGCIAIASATIDDGILLTVNASASAPVCLGDANGSIALNISNGDAPYNYSWTSSNDSGSGTGTQINNLISDSYTISVTDANSCEGTTTVLIEDGISLNVSGSATAVTCSAGTDGTITLNITGGTPAYTYNWNNGMDSGSGNGTLISGLTAGDYNITIIDANNCEGITAVSVNDGDLVQVEAIPNGVTCDQGSDGSIVLDISGGTPVYNYNWTSGGNSGSGSGTNIAGLVAGTYDITITDANGCIGTTSTTVDPGAPTSVIPNPMAVSCNGDSDGSILLDITGGTPNYTYNWTSAAMNGNGNGNLIENLSSGVYNITVTDADGCSGTTMTTVSQPDALSLGCAQNSPVTTVGGSDGIADITIEGGSPNFDLDWGTGSLLGQAGGTVSITNLSSGNFTVTLTDANGCQAECSFSISDPNCSMTASGEAQSPTCLGDDDGSIDITVLDNTGDLNFNWNDNLLDGMEDPSNLTAGSYTVTITDEAACVAIVSITVEEGTQITLNTTPASVTCENGNDGSISLDINGGSPDYSYNWTNTNDSGSGMGDLISDLVSDNYFITATDANGCTAATSVIVQDGMTINFSASSTNVSCSGGADGTLSFNITGGTPDYSYNWDNGTDTGIGMGTSVQNLMAGSYDITITDAQGCTATTFATINDGISIDLQATSNEVSCNGGSDGSISLTITGGTPTYNYNWVNGALSGDGSGTSIAGLSSGTYQITITDANGCTATTSVMLNEPEMISLSCSQNSPVTTVGGSDGVGEVIISGGTQMYTLNWGGGSLSGQEAGTVLIPNLQSGNYTVTVTDMNGCEETCSFTIGEPGCNLSITAEETNILCNGDADGQINITVSDATDPLIFDWNDDSLDGIEDPDNLMPGNYELTVTDGAACEIVTSVVISEPSPLGLICAENTPVSTIGGNDGVGELTISGGTTPYAIDWGSGSLNNQDEGTIEISDLIAGIYNVTVTDANNCIIECSFTITSPGCNISVEGTSTDVTCFGGMDGSIDLTVSNFNGMLDFDWNDDTLDGLEDPSGLSAGFYEVTITDEAACVTNISFTIEDGVQISLSADSTPSCSNSSDGNIELTVTNGTPVYNYTWQSGVNTDSGTGTLIDNLSPGDYAITITDANSCTATIDVSVEELTAPTAINISESCNLLNTEYTVSFEITGGDASSYIVTGGNGNLIGNLFTSDPITDGAAYSFTINDVNNCQPFVVDGQFDCPDCINVDFDLSITSDYNGQDISCFGADDGSIAISNISGGVGPYTIQWGNGEQSETIDNLSAGWMPVTVTDATGCTGIDSILLVEPSILQVVIELNDSPCFGDNDGTILFSGASGGTPPYSYSIDGQTFSNQSSFTNLSPGVYDLALQDANGCDFTETMDIFEPDELFVDLGMDTILNLGDSILITPVYNTITIDSFIWQGVDCVNCPEVIFTPTITSPISLTIIDGDGCSASDELMIGVNRRIDVFLPNIFSPNGDGINEIFYPQTNMNIQKINTMLVFDRWGETVWELYNFLPNDPVLGWNGEIRGRPAQSDVYVWYLEVLKVDGSIEIIKGDVTVAR